MPVSGGMGFEGGGNHDEGRSEISRLEIGAPRGCGCSKWVEKR